MGAHPQPTQPDGTSPVCYGDVRIVPEHEAGHLYAVLRISGEKAVELMPVSGEWR